MNAPETNGDEAAVERCCAELASNGYCVISNAAAPATITNLDDDLDQRFTQTPFCQGDFYGPRTKRFGGLLKHSRYTAKLVMHHGHGVRQCNLLYARTGSGSEEDRGG